jgi:predicted transcriptional regulator
MLGRYTQKSRRCAAEVLRDVLAAAEEGAKKTHIMFKSNVNPLVLKKYLGFCHQKGLLRTQENIYYLTPKGREFLAQLREVIQLKNNLSQIETHARQLITTQENVGHNLGSSVVAVPIARSKTSY